MTAEARLSSDLPEHFALLYDYKSGKFETPLDSRGIADVDAVFELAIRTYPEELPPFENTERNRHHLYWTEDWWRKYAAQQRTLEDKQTVWNFRNSAPQIAFVPIPIHRWIEVSQIPPPPPDLDTMRRRNVAWASASLLLKCAHELDKARTTYDEKRGKPRRVLSHIPGITTRTSRLSEEPLVFVDVLDDEYWLSELNSRLSSWKYLAQAKGTLPTEQGLLALPRLADVRNLRRRVHRDAFVPRVPEVAAA